MASQKEAWLDLCSHKRAKTFEAAVWISPRYTNTMTAKTICRISKIIKKVEYYKPNKKLFIHITRIYFECRKGKLTVTVMHRDSRIAPQHPKNAIMKIADPKTIKSTGTAMTFQSSNTVSRSSNFK